MLHERIETSSAQLAGGTARDVRRLTALERQVVMLSLKDGAATLLPDQQDGLLRRWFATRRANRLADPQLEALRRFAVSIRLGGARSAVPPWLSDAGVDEVRGLTARAVPRGTNQRAPSIYSVVALVAGAILLGLWVKSIIDDMVITAIIVGVVAVLILSWSVGRRRAAP